MGAGRTSATPDLASACHDCGRRLGGDVAAVIEPDRASVRCRDCVTLDAVHVLGTPGDGVGARLSAAASSRLKVLHGRRPPGVASGVAHLVVTPRGVWAVDVLAASGTAELRTAGLWARRAVELVVGGRIRTAHVDALRRRVAAVRSVLSVAAAGHGLPMPSVRAVLVLDGAEPGLLPSPYDLDGVWIGPEAAVRSRIVAERAGSLPVADLAKALAHGCRATVDGPVGS